MGSPSEELRSPTAFIAMLQRVLDDAATRVAHGTAEAAASVPDFSMLEIASFKQVWPDGSCGFSGIATQVLTDAQTVVVSWPASNVAVVYIAGAFAYRVEGPSPAFWEALSERRLPGAAEPHQHLSQG